MESYAVPIDWDKYWKDKLRDSKEDIFFLRGFFLNKTIDIENKLAYIIAQYCSEDSNGYNRIGRILMMKEISFSSLINVFNSSGIIDKSKAGKMTEKSC